MANELVTYEVVEGVAYLTLSNPPANAYSFEMMSDLDQAIIKARFAEDCHVIVLRGEGKKFFCAGADIVMLQSLSPAYKYNFCLHANETLLRLEHTSKLVIAAIEGHCVGGGLEIAMAADLRVAANGKGKFGLPEVALGVLPGTGGTQRMCRLLGKAKALELMCEGTLFDVEEALRIGMVHRTWDSDGFADHVHEYAKSFCPPNRAAKAVGLIKRSVQSGADLSLADGLSLERELQQRLFESEDAAIGLDAHVNKARPDFVGR